jgi:hypothetical protein
MGLGQTHKREFKMMSTCTTKQIRRLMQVKWKWCGRLNRDNLKHKLHTAHNLWEETPFPSLEYTLCLFVGTTSKCHFFPGLLSGSPKTRTFIVPKFWTFIYFLNQVCFENARAISYSFWKYLSNDIHHASIELHLIPAFKGFVVESQIRNLTLAHSFDHNSCKLGLNEQCKGI